jgi:hypothetical protein
VVEYLPVERKIIHYPVDIRAPTFSKTIRVTVESIQAKKFLTEREGRLVLSDSAASWHLVPHQEAFSVQSPASGRCLQGNASRVELAPFRGGSDQMWILELRGEIGQLKLASSPSKVLGLEAESTVLQNLDYSKAQFWRMRGFS